MSGVYPTPYWQLPPYPSSTAQPLINNNFGSVPFQMVNLTYVPPPPNSQISPWAPLSMEQRPNLKPFFSQSTTIDDKKSPTKKHKVQEPAYKIVEPKKPLLIKMDEKRPEINDKVAEKCQSGRKSVELIQSESANKSKPTPIADISCKSVVQSDAKISSPSAFVKERFRNIFEKKIPFVRQSSQISVCNLCDVNFNKSSRNLNEHCNGHRHKQTIKEYNEFLEKRGKEEKNEVATDIKLSGPVETNSKKSCESTKSRANSKSDNVTEKIVKPLKDSEKVARSSESSNNAVDSTDSSSKNLTKLVSNSSDSENSSKSVEKSSKRPAMDVQPSKKSDPIPKKRSRPAERKDSQDKEVLKAQRYFGCQICSIHGMSYSTELVQIHLNSKPHKIMKIFFDNRLWPGQAEKCQKMKLREPQIFKFLDRKGNLECQLCNEALPNGTELLIHQQGVEHKRKLTENNLLDKLPVIYLCEICNGDAFCGRDVYYKHTASAGHQDRFERLHRVKRLSQEDCYLFYTTGCPKGNNCIHRHCLYAMNSKEICQAWSLKGKCPRLGCPFRHSTNIAECSSLDDESVTRQRSDTTEPETRIHDFSEVDNLKLTEPVTHPELETSARSSASHAADPASTVSYQRERQKQKKLNEIIKAKGAAPKLAQSKKELVDEKISQSSIIDLVKNLKATNRGRIENEQKPEPTKPTAVVDRTSRLVQGSIVDFVKHLKPSEVKITPSLNVRARETKESAVDWSTNEIETVKPLNVFDLLKGLKSPPLAYQPTPSARQWTIIPDLHSAPTPAYKSTAMSPCQSITATSLESVTNLLLASKSDENLDVVLEILLQNEMTRTDCDQIRVMLIQNLIKMRNDRKESQKRLNQVMNLLNPGSSEASNEIVQPANQSDLMTILSLVISSLGNAATAAAVVLPQQVDQPANPGYINRSLIHPSDQPLKMATKFAAVCGMQKDELERKLKKFQSFDHRNGGQFVYAGKDYLENLDLLNVTGDYTISSEHKSSHLLEKDLMEIISDEEEEDDGLTPISSEDDEVDAHRYNCRSRSSSKKLANRLERRRSDSRSSERAKHNVYTSRPSLRDSQAHRASASNSTKDVIMSSRPECKQWMAFGRCESKSTCHFAHPPLAPHPSDYLDNEDPNVLLYYGNGDERDSSPELVVSNEKYVENFVVQVDNDNQEEKLPVFDRLGYFSKRGKKTLQEKRERVTVGKTTLFRTVRNNLCHR